MSTVALTDSFSLTACAVTTTFPAFGGAMYRVTPPEGVVGGVNEPQRATGAQLQPTPFGALVVAVMSTLVSAASDAGGGVLSVTVIPTMVIEEVLALTLELSLSVAVMTTGPEGTVLG